MDSCAPMTFDRERQVDRVGRRAARNRERAVRSPFCPGAARNPSSRTPRTKPPWSNDSWAQWMAWLREVGSPRSVIAVRPRHASAGRGDDPGSRASRRHGDAGVSPRRQRARSRSSSEYTRNLVGGHRTDDLVVDRADGCLGLAVVKALMIATRVSLPSCSVLPMRACVCRVVSVYFNTNLVGTLVGRRSRVLARHRVDLCP